MRTPGRSRLSTRSWRTRPRRPHLLTTYAAMSGHRRVTDHRPDQHHAPGVLVAEDGEHVAGEVDRTEHVGRDHAVEHLGRDLGERAVGHDSRAADHDVEAPVAGDGSRDGSGHLRVDAHVGGRDERRRGTEAVTLLGHPLQGGPAAGQQHDVVAAGGRCAAHGFADPARRSRHQDDARGSGRI